MLTGADRTPRDNPGRPFLSFLAAAPPVFRGSIRCTMCGGPTKHGKPYCLDHITHNPYAAIVAARLEPGGHVHPADSANVRKP